MRGGNDGIVLLVLDRINQKNCETLCVTAKGNQGPHISRSKMGSPAKLKKMDKCQSKHFCPALLIWCYQHVVMLYRSELFPLLNIEAGASMDKQCVQPNPKHLTIFAYRGGEQGRGKR